MVVDALGTDIKPGCYIAYAVREGSCYSALRVGKVTAVEVVKRTCHYSGPEERISVTILGGGHGTKKTTTSIPEHAVVLHPDGVPYYVKVLLEAA